MQAIGREDQPLTWKQLKDYYQSKRNYCGNGQRGRTYSLRHDKLIKLDCGSVTCGKCRPSVKKQLHEDIVRQAEQLQLNQHFIITSPGKQFRNEHTYVDSYRIQEYEWNKLNGVIQYHHPDFQYIRLPRAQTSPTADNPIGFSHQHILTNRPQRVEHEYKDGKLVRTIPTNDDLSFQWLDEKRKKYQLGFVWIRQNQNVAEYLANDFFHDDEWIIPIGKNHVATSRDIVLRPYGSYKGQPDNIYFAPAAPAPLIEKTIGARYGRSLPFEEYVKQFHDVTNTPQRQLAGTYINGKLVRPSSLDS